MPAIWKRTIISPIYKAGNKNDVENYRPIGILGAVSKVFDAIIAKKIADKLIHLITANQHGFVSGRSTITNLLQYNNYIGTALNKYLQVDSFYLDFAKAFDSVNHDILICKLCKLGLESYLQNREITVRIKGHLSDTFIAKSGVPQGLILGPLLFILFF